MTKSRFSDVVREARQRAGLSLRELGERIHKAGATDAPLSPQYLNDIEHGRRNPPDVDVVRQMAKALLLDASVLLALAGKEPQEVRAYLQEKPEESEAVGRLFRKARERGFADWAAIEKQIEKKDPDR